MEQSPSSTNTDALPRPQYGPYSGSWTTLFDSALKRVLARPDVANPPDVQISSSTMKASLEGHRASMATATARQIEHIDRVVEELHDNLVAVLANDRGRFARLSDTVFVTNVLTAKSGAAQADPADIPDLVAYAKTVEQWLKKPDAVPPRKSTFSPDPLGTHSRDFATGLAAQQLAQLYRRQKDLLTHALEQARNDRKFRVKAEELDSLRRDLSSEFESLLSREAYKEINNAQRAADEPTMSVPATDQLRETLTNEKPVVTETFRRLEKMILERREGSFGIAGPRGVGKSTMIEHFAAPRVPQDGPAPSGRPRLGIVVSAPVTYDAREFVLHLFAEICRKVAGDRAVEADRAAPATPAPPSRMRLMWLMAVAPVCLIFAFGLLLAALKHRVSAGGTLQADIGACVLAVGVVTVALIAHRVHDPDSGRVLGLLVVFATTWSAGGLVAFLFYGAWGTSWPFLLGGVALLGVGTALQRLRPQGLDPAPTQAPEMPGVETALERLREIRIQQSTTSERSIMLKVSGAALPLGVDAGGKNARTWQHRPKGYPELVGDLRTFLTTVQRHYELIIGIDELDKMAKAEKVEDFLNDIKAIFGVKGCFFLVSVSEDAAAGFERRGVPFRDVFDSSFDEVISVPHLDFRTAREVLFGLIIGWTQPFVALCYAMSGGLPRDLVRSTRELVEYRDGNDRIELAQAALGMCRREACARVRAVRHELMKNPDVAQSAELLNRIAEYSPDGATAGMFHSWQTELRNWAEKVIDPDARPVVRLALELSAFMLFVATVLDFFDPVEIAQRLKDTTPARALANLANARQTIAMSPRMSLDALTRFRNAWSLPPRVQ